MSGFEANFDGLVGPTHHYAGLSVGNEASQNNRDGLSNPKKAELQGLYKMKALADRGFVQGILPPQPRPNLIAPEYNMEASLRRLKCIKANCVNLVHYHVNL